MSYLLDTHTFVWAATLDKRLSPKAQSLIEERSNKVFVSPVSLFEMSTKHRLGKWPEVAQLLKIYSTLIEALEFESLPLQDAHAVLAGSYPQDHRDPFDRLLIAQAQHEKLSIISRDAAFTAFEPQVIW